MTNTDDPVVTAIRSTLRAARTELSYAPPLEEFLERARRRDHRARRRLLACTVTAVAVAAATIGLILGGAAHRAAVVPAAPPSPTLDVNDLYHRAQTALAGAHALRIEMSSLRPGSGLWTADLTIDAHGGFAFDLQRPDHVGDWIRIVGNDLYVRGPDLVPASTGHLSPDAWIEQPGGAITFRTLLEAEYAPEHLAKCFLATHGDLHDDGPSEADGRPTERIDSGPPNRFTVEIARDGTPYPLVIVSPDSSAPALPADCGGITGGPFATVDLSGTQTLQLHSIDDVADVTPPQGVVDVLPTSPGPKVGG